MVSELEYQENCQSNQYSEETRECNSWDREKCPSPCERVKCPAFAKCQASQLFSSQIPKIKVLPDNFLTDSYIGFTLKMESVSKNTIFGLKMMVESGLEKIFLKFLHAGDYVP